MLVCERFSMLEKHAFRHFSTTLFEWIPSFQRFPQSSESLDGEQLVFPAAGDGFWGVFPSLRGHRLAAGNVFVEWRFIARSGFPLLSLHVLRVGAAGDGWTCFSRNLPWVAESTFARWRGSFSWFFVRRCVQTAEKASPLDVATYGLDSPTNCWKQRFPVHRHCCGKLCVFAGGLS